MHDTSGPQHKSAKDRYKTVIYDKIGNVDTRKRSIDEDQDWRRRVLTGGFISTNRHQLNILA
ncbi:hypothetical protein BGZ75_009730, partial [Mortierella antarctica]